MSELNVVQELFKCPACKTRLEIDNEQQIITCENQHSFGQSDHKNALNLVYPKELSGPDAEFYEQYKQIAEMYDNAAESLFAMHGTNQSDARTEIVEVLGLKPGARVLEISTGTGLNIPYLREKIGEEGEIVALDLSPNMLHVAQQKFENKEGYENVRFLLANASSLPFEDNYFDAIFHVGGINTFTEKKQAIDEIQRVVKVGGRVVLSDEGMGLWNLGTEYGTKLLKINGLYKDQPPMDLLPVEIEEVKLSYIMGNAFYVLEWKKRDSQPVLNNLQNGQP